MKICENSFHTLCVVGYSMFSTLISTESENEISGICVYTVPRSICNPNIDSTTVVCGNRKLN